MPPYRDLADLPNRLDTLHRQPRQMVGFSWQGEVGGRNNYQGPA
ncbi:hypothetical protein CCP3SC1_20065 [Gammaproteobacteria bacterium]